MSSDQPRCDDCNKFIKLTRGVAWEACGEFGEETRYVCVSCQGPDFKPQASNGSKDIRWCGFLTAGDE